MNSNEIVGRLRPSMSAMRMVWALYLRTRTSSTHRVRQRRRCGEKTHQLWLRPAGQLDLMDRRRQRPIALDNEAVVDQSLDHGRKGGGRHTEPAPQLLARHARPQWIRSVIRLELA